MRNALNVPRCLLWPCKPWESRLATEWQQWLGTTIVIWKHGEPHAMTLFIILATTWKFQDMWETVNSVCSLTWSDDEFSGWSPSSLENKKVDDHKLGVSKAVTLYRYGIMGMGAICHTLNPRLFPQDVIYIAGHAEDKVLMFDLTFLKLIEAVKPKLTSVEAFIIMTDRQHMPKDYKKVMSSHCILKAGCYTFGLELQVIALSKSVLLLEKLRGWLSRVRTVM